jgi:hypothetical protein
MAGDYRVAQYDYPNAGGIFVKRNSCRGAGKKCAKVDGLKFVVVSHLLRVAIVIRSARVSPIQRSSRATDYLSF